MHHPMALRALLFITVISSSLFAKTFKFSEDAAPTTFDPVQNSSLVGNVVITAVYDTLYEYKYLKTPYELKTNLAKSLPMVSKDGLTYTIEIKNGVYFQDDPSFNKGKGREVVASDFVYSLKRHFDPKNKSRGAWLWQGKIKGLDAWKKAGSDYNKDVAGLKALSKYKIQIVLTKPFPQLTYTLAMGQSAVVAKEAILKYGKEISIKPVGSGPFILTSHTRQKTVLIKNPKYRKDVFSLKKEGYNKAVHGFTGISSLEGKTMPIVDKVELNWIKEEVARWNSFTKGNEVQWTVLNSRQLDNVLKTKQPVILKDSYAKKYHVRSGIETGLRFIHFNMDNDSIGYHKNPKQNEKNKALRCSIRMAYDWPATIRKFYLGLGEAYPGFVPPGVDGYDPNLSKDSVTHQPKKAKEFLKKHGWNSKNLPTLELHNVSSVKKRQEFEHFRGSLRAIGYPKNKIKFKGYAAFGDLTKAISNRKAMLIPMGWGLDYPDAENTLALFYGPNASPGSNQSNYNNPAYNKLFAKASTMQPSPERTKMYQKLSSIMVEDCPSISSYSRTQVFLWHKNTVMWPQRDVIGNILKYVDVK